MANLPLADLAHAAQKFAATEAIDFLEGLQTFLQYVNVAPQHEMSGMQCWSSGAARLLEYIPEGPVKSAVFLVPSLINRANLLDLTPTKSLARYMAANGVHCFLLDWGVPGAAEKSMAVVDYIDSIMAPAIDRASKIYGGRVSLLGYCMGGMLSLAAAQRLGRKKISGISLLATPWDFHSEGSHTLKLDNDAIAMLRQWIGQAGELPPWFLQPMFYRSDPWLFTRKFRKFPAMSAVEKNIFVAVERWLNGGVALAPRVAETCLIEWAHGNSPMLGKWLVGGKPVNPAQLDMPVMAIMPKRDSVVPASSMEPLLKLMPWAEVLRPDTGHIGMIINKNAATDIWQPLLNWVSRL